MRLRRGGGEHKLLQKHKKYAEKYLKNNQNITKGYVFGTEITSTNRNIKESNITIHSEIGNHPEQIIL